MGFIDKSQEKAKEKYNEKHNEKIIHTKYTEHRRKTGHRDGSILRHRIPDISGKRWTAGEACIGRVCNLREEF